jgi:hypothetical protein
MEIDHRTLEENEDRGRKRRRNMEDDNENKPDAKNNNGIVKKGVKVKREKKRRWDAAVVAVGMVIGFSVIVMKITGYWPCHIINTLQINQISCGKSIQEDVSSIIQWNSAAVSGPIFFSFLITISSKYLITVISETFGIEEISFPATMSSIIAGKLAPAKVVNIVPPPSLGLTSINLITRSGDSFI